MEESDTVTFDLGKLIELLFRQAQLILASMLVCAIVAGVVSLITPKTYQASVLVATTKVASSVSFGSAIETKSDENLLSGATLDRKARLQSYVELVKNPIVAQSVLDQLGDRIEPEYRRAAALMDNVEGKVVGGSDTIEVQVTYPEAGMAAEIANAWGEAYIRQVNQIYADETTNVSFPAVKQKTVEAKKTYDQAQADLETFIALNQVDELAQQITETQKIIDNLSLFRLTAVDEQTNNIRARLTTAFADSRNIDQYLMAAVDMRDQVTNGGPGAAASNAMALILLKSQIFTSSDVSQSLGNITLQTGVATMTEQEMIADLNSLIGALQLRRENLDMEIQSISTQLLSTQDGPAKEVQTTTGAHSNGLNPNSVESILKFNIEGTNVDKKIQDLQQHNRDLQEKKARDEGREMELTRARDLAWETYKNLVTKEAELSVVTGIQGMALSLASPAIEPEWDTMNSKKNVLIAAVVGLMLGVLSAYAIEFWWNYKGLQPVPIRIIKIRIAEDRTRK